MKSQTKRPKFIAREVRELIAENVRRRMDDVFEPSANRTEALAKRIGTSKSTIQRVLNCEVGITVDVLAQLAMGLQCQPYDLLRPQGVKPAKQ